MLNFCPAGSSCRTHLAGDAEESTRCLLLLLYIPLELRRNVSYGKAQDHTSLLKQPEGTPGYARVEHFWTFITAGEVSTL